MLVSERLASSPSVYRPVSSGYLHSTFSDDYGSILLLFDGCIQFIYEIKVWTHGRLEFRGVSASRFLALLLTGTYTDASVNVYMEGSLRGFNSADSWLRCFILIKVIFAQRAKAIGVAALVTTASWKKLTTSHKS